MFGKNCLGNCAVKEIVLYVEIVLEHRIYDFYCVSGLHMGCFGSTIMYIPLGSGLNRRGCRLKSIVVLTCDAVLDLTSGAAIIDHHRIIIRSSINPTDHRLERETLGRKSETFGRSRNSVGNRE
jgi:hypothetical protein